MRHLSWIPVTCLAVCLVAAGTGCAPPASDRAAAVAPGTEAALDALYAGTGEVRAAQDVLVSRCLARAGPDDAPAPRTEDMSWHPTYSTDVGRAEREGYGLAGERVAVRRLLDDEAERDGSPGSERRERALHGPAGSEVEVEVGGLRVVTPGEGCVAEAQVALYGSVEAAVVHEELVGNVVRSVLEPAADAPSVAEALGDWETCMAGRGHPGLVGREAARSLAEAHYPVWADDRARAAELRLATDDAVCDREVGYAAVRMQADLARFSTFRSDHGVLVGEATQAYAAARRAAGAVLAQEPR